MDGLSRLAGVGPTIVLGGERLRTAGRTLRHFAEIEAEIIRERGNPFVLIREILPSDGRKRIVEAVYKDVKNWPFVPIETIEEWLATWRGIVFQTWQAVRHNHPRWTHETVSRSILDGLERHGQGWITGIVDAIRQASGDDELSRIALWRAPVFTERVSATDEDEPTEWARIFRYLASEPYSMTHEQILDMPLSAISLYLMSDQEANRELKAASDTQKYAKQCREFHDGIVERLAG